MNTFKIQLRRFFENKLLLILTSLYFIGTIGYMLITTMAWAKITDVVSVLNNSVMFSTYTQIFFLFISFEYLIKLKTSHAHELIFSTKNGICTYYASGMGVLTLLLAVHTIIFFLINLAVYFYLGINHTEYILHILLNCVVYLFAAPFVGILLGSVLTFCKKRVSAYLLMIVFCIITSRIATVIGIQLYSDAGLYIFDAVNFFDFTTYLTEWENVYPIASAVLPYKIAHLCIWVSGLLLVIIFALNKHKRCAKTIGVFLCAVACMVSFYVYLQPTSKIGLTEDPKIGRVSDNIYYSQEECPQKQETADFSIEKYDLDVTIKNNLSVRATLYLKDVVSDEYKFTLYHGYIISKITDVNGNLLEFQRENDYVTVYGNKDALLDTLIMEYSGSAPLFFSNSCGVSLPGFFPYYPMGGFKEVYSTKEYCFNCIENEPTLFELTVSSPRKIYCNLEETANGTYIGTATGLTIISGFYDTFQVNGVEVVYPYLDKTMDNTEETLKAYAEDFLAVYESDSQIKKILVISDANLKYCKDDFAVFDDHVVSTRLFGMDGQYIYQKMNSQKRALKSVIEKYQLSIDFYSAVLESSRNTGETADENPILLFDEKINELGADYVIEQSIAYIENDTDTRSNSEFLTQLR